MLPAKSSRLRSWTNISRRKLCARLPKIDSKIDPKLRRAATIAEERARAHSLSKCWRYVKEALVAAGVVKSRPQTPLAKQAGQELVKNYGFKKLPVSDPYQAPVGAVLVYGAKRAAGHVEIRTQNGFVSDFRSKTPSRRPLIGVFAKSLGRAFARSSAKSGDPIPAGKLSSARESLSMIAADPRSRCGRARATSRPR